MEKQEIFKNLTKVVSEEKIMQNEPMKGHTSFKIGGMADFFIKISSIEELKQILEFAKKEKIEITVIGNGSNILVLDKGIKGIVIKLELKEIQIKEVDKNIEVIVDSGVTLGFLSQRLLKEQISGLEELSGIPGTIGGATIMNAGAHGKEMKDIVIKVIAMDYNGQIHEFTNEESKFEYRRSIYSNGKYIVLQVHFLLNKGNKEQIKEKMDEYLKYRREKQPIEYPSAGSTFKRGKDFITAKLIDDAGLKGYSIGDAQVSEKHAGFIINKGNASAQDILDLVSHIQRTIFEKFGKKVELEIKVIGE